MPTYKITDPSTGRAMRVTGDAPPGPDDVEELFSHAPPAESVGKKILKTALAPAAWAAEKLDSFTGAPIRQGLTKAQDYTDTASTPTPMGAALAALRGAAGQFGRDPSGVPTGKQVYERAGYSGTPTADGVAVNKSPGMGVSYYNAPLAGAGVSPAGALGLALDMATPIPGAGEAKAAGGVTLKMAKEGGKLGMEAGGKALGAAAKATDVLTNTGAASKALEAAKGGLDAAGEGFKNLGEALARRYGGKMAPDASKYIQIAQRNGIDPTKLHEAVLFGPASSAAHLARAQAETALGAPLREQHAEMANAIQGAIQNDIRRIGGEVKDEAGKVVKPAQVPATTQEAGDLIKSAYDSKVEQVMGNMDVTYGGLAKKAPGSKIPPEAMKKLNDHLGELEKYATDLGVDSFDETTTSQAKHLLETVDKVRNAGDSFPAVVRGMQGLGRTAFKVKTPVGTIPPDLNKLRSLYGQLSETVASGAEANFGKETADKLRANNKTMSEMFGDKAIIPALGDAGKSEDKLFRSLILQGDAKRIKTLKKYLSPEQIQQVKAAALQTLLKDDKGFKTMGNRLSNKEDAFNALFDKGELDNMKDLIDLGQRQGNAVLSTSGTGGSVAHQAAAWGDLVRPDKWLNKAEAVADKHAASGQRKAMQKATGTAPPPTTPPPGSAMVAGGTLRDMLHNGPAFKKKGLQMYGAEKQNQKDN